MDHHGAGFLDLLVEDFLGRRPGDSPRGQGRLKLTAQLRRRTSASISGGLHDALHHQLQRLFDFDRVGFHTVPALAQFVVDFRGQAASVIRRFCCSTDSNNALRLRRLQAMATS